MALSVKAFVKKVWSSKTLKGFSYNSISGKSKTVPCWGCLGYISLEYKIP